MWHRAEPAPGVGVRGSRDLGWRLELVIAVLMVVLLAACGVTPSTFYNPVIDRDFPDPAVLRVGDTFYAYATNAGATNVQVAKSRDVVHWEALQDALPTLPHWAKHGRTWAPHVSAIVDQRASYVLYFVAQHAASSRQCIGLATSASPAGPFTPTDDNPLICQLADGGSIDPYAFVDDDGTRYVLWKNDGNCCNKDTWIYLQKMSADGLTLLDAPHRLIRADQAWEGFVVEAPTLWKRKSTYYLFYSANSYANEQYAVGYAVADSPLGPYRKSAGPLLETSTMRGPVIGPGGQDIVVTRGGQTWLVYHSWDPTISYRGMHLDELTWDNDTPIVNGPTRGVPRSAPEV